MKTFLLLLSLITLMACSRPETPPPVTPVKAPTVETSNPAAPATSEPPTEAVVH